MKQENIKEKENEAVASLAPGRLILPSPSASTLSLPQKVRNRGAHPLLPRSFSRFYEKPTFTGGSYMARSLPGSNQPRTPLARWPFVCAGTFVVIYLLFLLSSYVSFLFLFLFLFLLFSSFS